MYVPQDFCVDKFARKGERDTWRICNDITLVDRTTRMLIDLIFGSDSFESMFEL